MSRSPFLQSVTDLLRGRASSRPVEFEAPVTWSVEMFRVVPDPPLRADLQLTPVSGGVLVRGSVIAEVRQTCHRCLDEYDETTQIEVAQLYQPAERADDDDYVFHGEEIDLEPMLRDEVLLSAPLVPTCGDDCPGLVAPPETDLNGGAPDEGRTSASPFAVLQDLLGPGD